MHTHIYIYIYMYIYIYICIYTYIQMHTHVYIYIHIHVHIHIRIHIHIHKHMHIHIYIHTYTYTDTYTSPQPPVYRLWGSGGARPPTNSVYMRTLGDSPGHACWPPNTPGSPLDLQRRLQDSLFDLQKNTQFITRFVMVF